MRWPGRRVYREGKTGEPRHGPEEPQPALTGQRRLSLQRKWRRDGPGRVRGPTRRMRAYETRVENISRTARSVRSNAAGRSSEIETGKMPIRLRYMWVIGDLSLSCFGGAMKAKPGCSRLRHEWEVRNRQGAQTTPSQSLAVVWRRGRGMGQGRFIVLGFFSSLFKGRRDLNLFKYHWEGSQLR